MGCSTRVRCMPKNIYKRGKIWWGRVQVAGCEHRKSLRTRDRAVAKARQAEWQESLIGQAHFGEHRPTWDEALLRYVQDVMPEQVKASTAERYLTSFRQVHHMLTGLYLDKIGRKELFAVVSRKGPTNATKRRDFTAVAAVLSAASTWGWLDVDPAKTFDLKVVRERRDPVVLPEHHEIQKLVDNCPSDMLSRMVKVLWLTGMRLNEASTLEWKEVSTSRSALQLNKTKTDSPRAVPLSTEAVGTISGTPRFLKCGWVFWHDDGEPFKNLSSRFALIKKRLGLNFRIHDLRHRFAVDYLRDGVGSIYDLQKVLGHKSIKTTEIYLRYLTPEEHDQATRSAQNSAQ